MTIAESEIRPLLVPSGGMVISRIEVTVVGCLGCGLFQKQKRARWTGDARRANARPKSGNGGRSAQQRIHRVAVPALHAIRRALKNVRVFCVSIDRAERRIESRRPA